MNKIWNFCVPPVFYLSKPFYARAYSSTSFCRCIINQPPFLPPNFEFLLFSTNVCFKCCVSACVCLCFRNMQKIAVVMTQFRRSYEELICNTVLTVKHLRSDNVISRSDCTFTNFLCYFTINICLLYQNIVI